MSNAFAALNERKCHHGCSFRHLFNHYCLNQLENRFGDDEKREPRTLEDRTGEADALMKLFGSA
jgi:hypothetical protein